MSARQFKMRRTINDAEDDTINGILPVQLVEMIIEKAGMSLTYAGVCKLWRRIVLRNTTKLKMKNVLMEGTGYFNGNSLPLLPTSPSLTEFRYVTEVEIFLRSHRGFTLCLPLFPAQVQRMTIRVDTQNLNVNCRQLSKLPNLQMLHLICEKRDRNEHDFARCFHLFPLLHLTSLCLQGRGANFDGALEVPRLQKFSMHQQCITSHDLQQVQHCAELRSLTLGSLDEPEAILSDLSDLRLLTQITELNVCGMRFLPGFPLLTNITTLATGDPSILNRLPNLTSLELHCSTLGRGAVVADLTRFHLHHLTLSLNMKFSENFAEWLPNLPRTLLSLHLKSLPVVKTTDGVKLLSCEAYWAEMFRLKDESTEKLPHLQTVRLTCDEKFYTHMGSDTVLVVVDR